MTGALIAGGAALIGFTASGWQTNRTIRANRQIARDQRLWDKKTALYEAIDAAVEFPVDEDGFPLPEMDPEAVRSVRDALDAVKPAVRLYAGRAVSGRYLTVGGSLYFLIRGSTEPYMKDYQTSVRKLTAAMRADLLGPEVPLRVKAKDRAVDVLVWIIQRPFLAAERVSSWWRSRRMVE